MVWLFAFYTCTFTRKENMLVAQQDGELLFYSERMFIY